jgi:hypothetical protein
MSEQCVSQNLLVGSAERYLLQASFSNEFVLQKIQNCKADRHRFGQNMNSERVFVAHKEVKSQKGHFPIKGFALTVEKDQVADSLTAELINFPAESERLTFKPLVKYVCYSEPLIWYDDKSK